MSNSHFFFAVPLPKNIKIQVNEVCEKVRKSFQFKRWVHEEDFHITLAFLGDSPIEQLETAKSYVEQNIQDVDPFILKINHMGTFGRNDAPRILWAGIEESSELNRLRDMVYSICQDTGFQLDKKPFRPHITLARKWEGDPSFSLEKLQSNIIEIPSFSINEVVLYETIIDATPKYKTRTLFTL